jgi:hypothetical protein
MYTKYSSVNLQKTIFFSHSREEKKNLTALLVSHEDDQEGNCSPGTCNQKKVAYLGFQCLNHPPYSPDLAPSDYHLFPGLKKQLKGK